jgi:virulence factor Mce-like protein
VSRRRGARTGADERRFLAAAGIAVVLLAIAIYAATWRELPFGDSFEVRGVFSTSNQLRSGNPVRRAGVDIGKVTAIEAGPDDTSVVRMELDDHAHLRSNASLTIKPRLFFVGNFYVDISAGTPAAPELADGATIPLDRTSGPVQVDQVLSTLTEPVRDALTGTIDELATGLGGPDGIRGSDELRRATRELDAALVSVERTARAVQGTEAGDLHRAVGSAADFTDQLARDPDALAGLVSDFDRVAGALSSDPDSLSASVRSFNEVLRVAPASLREIDAALPVLTRFAEDLRPGLRAAPPALDATTGLLYQLQLAAQPGELSSLVRDLEPLTANLPALQPPLARGLELLDKAAQCMNRTILPALETKLPDGPNSTFRPVWQDILHLGANLLGSSAGFDGNGGTLRLGLAEGANALQEYIPGIGELTGNGEYEGVNPVWLGAGVQPEFRPDAWCKDQKIPDYGARSRLGTPVNKRVIPKRVPGKAEMRRRSEMLALLTGDRADRRSLLRMLLKELPLRRDDGQARRRRTGKRPAVAPSIPRPKTGGGQPQNGSPAPRDTVKDIVEGLLGGPKGGSDQSPEAQQLERTVDGILNGILGRRGGR